MNVSIIIPCYNNAQWVAQSIESALAQEGIEPSVWVIDDHSTDGSWDVISSFGDRIQALRLDQNQGGNPARQRGLEKVTTEWVQFLDADDVLLPQKIVHQLAVAEASTDLVYGPVIERIEQGDHATPVDIAHHLPSPGDPAVHWLRWQCAHTAAALWRTNSLREIGGWNSKQTCCQDNELSMRALLAGLQMVSVPAPEVLYRIWSDRTLSRKHPERILRERDRLTEQVVSALLETDEFTPARKAAASQSFFEMARSLYQIDAQKACAYAHEKRARGLFTPVGPAASRSYRFAYRVGGFALAEKLAQSRRRTLASSTETAT